MGNTTSEGVRFAHPSEAQVARLLDFYQVRYEYEPRTFELASEGANNDSDAVGHPAMLRFTPDFYLPEHDVFLEVTTVKPAFAYRKNRKIRRLRALYPDINIKLLGLKDVEALVQRGRGSDVPSPLVVSFPAPAE